MSYKITITELVTTRKSVQGQWVVLGTNEVARDPEFWRDMKDQPKSRIEEIHGYAPDREQDVTTERQILCQQVEELDLIEVIKAVNGIGSKL